MSIVFCAPGLKSFPNQAALLAIALLSSLIAAAMPILEFVSFSANLAGAALTAFGLSLNVRDGLLALLAFLLTAGTVALLTSRLI